MWGDLRTVRSLSLSIMCIWHHCCRGTPSHIDFYCWFDFYTKLFLAGICMLRVYWQSKALFAVTQSQVCRINFSLRLCLYVLGHRLGIRQAVVLCCVWRQAKICFWFVVLLYYKFISETFILSLRLLKYRTCWGRLLNELKNLRENIQRSSELFVLGSLYILM